MKIIVYIMTVVLLLFTEAVAIVTPNLRSRSLSGVILENVVCEIQKLDVTYEHEGMPVDFLAENSEEMMLKEQENPYVCFLGEQVYGIELPENIRNQIDLQDESKSFLTISNAVIDQEQAELSIEEGATVVVGGEVNGRRRKLASSKHVGQKVVLVLRVKYFDRVPTYTSKQLAGLIFGAGPTPFSVNVADQYRACSFGKLDFVPATGEGIEYGVAEISINTAVSGDFSARLLENLVADNAELVFGGGKSLSELFDLVLLVLPEAGLRYGGQTYLAYGFLNGYRSVYNDLWGGRISALAHEIGHNLNLHHSGGNGESYGDITGYMGYGVQEIGFPAMCFNGQKHWVMGWFEDRARSFYAIDLPYSGYLATFVDYNMTTSELPVLISLIGSEKRLFLQYNSKKGMNSQTRSLPDQVVIVGDSGTKPEDSGLPSWLEGGIMVDHPSASDVYRYRKFDDDGYDLVITVCSAEQGPPDYVRLSIHLDNGKQQSTCNDDIASGEGKSQTTQSTMETGCEDSTEEFLIPGKSFPGNCGWIGRYEEYRQMLCVEGEDAYELCPDTCGRCTDDCTDSIGSFYVEKLGREMDCFWLVSKPSWQETLCKQGNDAYKLCVDTCNVCDRR